MKTFHQFLNEGPVYNGASTNNQQGQMPQMPPPPQAQQAQAPPQPTMPQQAPSPNQDEEKRAVIEDLKRIKNDLDRLLIKLSR